MKEDLFEQSLYALLIGEYEKDRLVLREIFRRLDWRLFEAPDRRGAMRCLRSKPVHVVIAQTEVPDWNWKQMLQDLRRLALPPQLIITSRHADNYLWAEALNVGVYDVLLQPFERDEVERVVASARRHFNFRPELAGRAPLRFTGIA